MTRLGLIGHGAIAQFLARALDDTDMSVQLAGVLARPGREAAARAAFRVPPHVTTEPSDLARSCDLVVDCAGHAGLRAHGAAILRQGCPLITLSLGALADAALADGLRGAARQGGTFLRLAPGAIGGLDALSAAAMGRLDGVRYTGRKPPAGWRGSAAEEVLSLDTLDRAQTHFEGSAREAALRYPKNANVAAAVALAGVGFDDTRVHLIADPAIDQNRHRIEARGDFGTLDVQIGGNSLPDNPRTSALAAMSALRQVLTHSAPIRL